MGDIFSFRTIRHGPPRRLSTLPFPTRRGASRRAGAFRYSGFIALASLIAGAVLVSEHWYGGGKAAPGAYEEIIAGNRSIRYATGPRDNANVTVSTEIVAIDGDSLRSGAGDIRLLGADAPELFQTCRDGARRDWACGREAHARLKAFVARGGVRCQSSSRDRYGRSLARCSAGPVADLGEVMVREGFALDFMDGGYRSAEAEARKTKRGIWGGTFDLPQEHRRRNPRRLDRG